MRAPAQDIEAQLRNLASEGRFAACYGAALDAYGSELLGFLAAIVRDEDRARRLFRALCHDLWRELPGFDGSASFRLRAYRAGCSAALRHRATERLGELALEDRIVLVLRVDRGFDWDTIADVLACSRTEVEARFARVEEHLQTSVAPHAVEETLRSLACAPRLPAHVPALGESNDRFRIIRRLGAGGMGSVDLVWDAVREERVARKRCHPLEPGSSADDTRRGWSRLKREFRSVVELRHPALVTLHELGEDEVGVYFTMEAIDGVDLSIYCRGPGSLSLPRAACALPPILEALAHLHARGLVHRDLKPTNVIVDAQDRARILDFGVLAELSAPSGEVAGTLAYMAPEQIQGKPPSPSMDLYALGITLFELAAGHRPFHARSSVALIGQHLLETPPRLTGVPDAFADAVEALLRKKPAERPSLAQVAERLLPAIGARAAVIEIARPDEDLVGREEISRSLAEALAGSELDVIVLEGPTGVGKTALARQVAGQAIGMRVLRGRARRNELLAFNAIDGIVEDLAELLEDLGSDERLTGHRRRAAVAFPALGNAEDADRAGGRAAAFDALLHLLGAAAGDGMLLVVDDLQWADDDSLAFVRAFVDRAPAGVKMLATMRDDLPTPRITALLDAPRVRCVRLDALDENALACIALRASGDALDDASARSLAAQCDGRAYLAEVAGRLAAERGAPPRDLGEALARRIGGLSDTTQRVLAALLASEGWLSARDIAAALDVAPGRLDTLMLELVALAIVRRDGTGDGERLDLYHDVAREAARETIGEELLRDGHAALAALFDTRPDADPGKLVRHLQGAGRLADAALRAEEEARKADSRRAYGLAAQLYEIAAQGKEPAQARRLRRARTTSLIRGGQYDAALREIDALGGGDDGVAFDRAYARLMAGAIDAGKEALNETLRLRGLRPLAKRGAAVVRDVVRFYAGPPRAPRIRAAAQTDTVARERREREAEVALLLSWEDPLAAVGWAQRIRKLGDAEGHPERGAFADYVLAFLATAGRAKADDVRLPLRYLESARSRAVDIASEPHLAALDGAVQGLLRLKRGEFRAAADDLAHVISDLEEAGLARTHTHLLVSSNRCGALLSTERPREIAAAIQALEAACPPMQGAMEAHTLVHRAVHAVYVGDREAHAAYVARMAERAALDAEPRFHHLINALYGGLGALYWGDPIATREAFARAMRDARRFRPMSTYFAGSFASLLALAEAAALRAGDRHASPRRVARWTNIARRATPFFVPAAFRASAYVADHLGRPDRALAFLVEAEACADRHDQICSGAIARYQRGILLGGDEGRALVERARAELASVGAHAHLLEEAR